MALTTEEVDKIAKLARLKIDDQKKQKMQHELTEILDYIGQIQTLTQKGDISFAEDPDAINLMRDDVAEPVEDVEKFLTQAPAREGNFVKVKSVLE